jgi:hypothetical protein
MMPVVRPSSGDVFTVPLPEKEEVAFTAAKDGLPIFHGVTYEEHLEAWRHVTESVECRMWALAAIVASLERSRGAAAVVEFAKDVSVSKSRLYSMAKTYRAFENSKRLENRSFHLHTVAAEADNPVAAINKADSHGWTTRQLERYIETGLEPGETSGINAEALAIATSEPAIDTTAAKDEESEDSPLVPGPDLKAIANHAFRDFLLEFLGNIRTLKTKCPNPKFSSDVLDYIEEEINEYLEQLLLDDLKAKVIKAWGLGSHQENQIASACGIPSKEIHGVMMAYKREGLFEVIKRAKTTGAKGKPPWKWHLVGQPIGSDYQRPS